MSAMFLVFSHLDAPSVPVALTALDKALDK